MNLRAFVAVTCLLLCGCTHTPDYAIPEPKPIRYVSVSVSRTEKKESPDVARHRAELNREKQALQSVTNNKLSNPRIERPDIDVLTRKAQENNATAQYDLGRIYFEGSWLPKNRKLAAYWLRKSAEQNYAKAQFYMVLLMGLLHFDNMRSQILAPDERETFEKKNEDIEKEFIKWNKLAFTNLEYLAESGAAEAQHMLSRLCFGWKGIGEDKQRAAELRGKAIQNYKEAAEQGDIKAMRCLGEIYSFTPANESEKIRWYTKAARQGDCISQYKLGLFYRSEKEYAKAIEWYTKAAEQGHIEAQYELGTIYNRMVWTRSQANEVKAFHNDLKAIEWLRQAAQKGHPDAQNDLAFCYRSMERIQDCNEAVKWYTKAAEQGHRDAQGVLALMYDLGEEVDRDHKKALKWYKRQAEQARDVSLSFFAQQSRIAHISHSIADIYYYDNKEYAQAFEWYQKAANGGWPDSHYMLGKMYYEGLGTERNVKKSAMWYTKAAESGRDLAQFCLARMYYKGEGVAQDYVEAYKWANLAAMKDERYRGLRDAIKEEMTKEQIAEGQKKAAEFHRKRMAEQDKRMAELKQRLKGEDAGD